MQTIKRSRGKKIASIEKYPVILSWGMPFIIIASYCFLAFQSDLRVSIHTLAGTTACITVVLSIILYAGEKRRFNLSPAVVITVAVIIRVLFLFRPPELSDDIYRYLWDGLQMLKGHNPYSLAPSEIQTTNKTLSSLLGHINHPELTTIYPPAAQLIFAAGAAFGSKILGMKILLTAIDIATCFAILRLLSFLKLPLWRSILYAWHPLPVLEISASGHIDGAGMFFLFIALILLAKIYTVPASGSLTSISGNILRRRLLSLSSGFIFAFAILVKFIPAVFLPVPLFPMKNRMRMFFLAGLLAGLTVLVIPFLPEIKNLFMTLDIYLQNWEFSGFLFRVLMDTTSSGNIARLTLLILFFTSLLFLYSGLWNRKNQAYYSENSSEVLLVIRTFYFTSIIFLLLTTTLYPWYALILAGFLPFAAGTAGIVLSWAVFLSYRILILYAYTGQWSEDNITPAIIFFAPVAGFFLACLSGRSKKTGQSLYGDS